MKKSIAFTLGLALVGSAAVANAGSDRDDLALCKHELKKVYGQETRVKLKGIKRSSEGNKLRLVALPGDGDSHRATCWVDREGMINATDRDGADLLAGVSSNSADEVSLNR